MPRNTDLRVIDGDPVTEQVNLTMLTAGARMNLVIGGFNANVPKLAVNYDGYFRSKLLCKIFNFLGRYAG